MSSELALGKAAKAESRNEQRLQHPLLSSSQTSQRIVGNFYIDIGDVTAAANSVNLHIFFKNDLRVVENNQSGCSICIDSVDIEDLEINLEHIVQDMQSLLDCDENPLKHNIVHVDGYLVHKYGKLLRIFEEKGDISAKY